MKEKKYVSKTQALDKLRHYCAYRDRCHKEVRTKLLDLGIYGDDLEEIISQLIEENFLNEERFARSYARGKFRLIKFGRTRIRRELEMRGISDYCIRKAMTEIGEEDYLRTLREVIEKKSGRLKEPDEFVRKGKVAQYAIKRGFESNLVWEVLGKPEGKSD